MKRSKSKWVVNKKIFLVAYGETEKEEFEESFNNRNWKHIAEMDIKNLIEEDSSIEISVIRNSFKHGKKSYGWSGNDKLILFNSLDLIDSKESIEWMIQVAETVAEALNSKKL